MRSALLAAMLLLPLAAPPEVHAAPGVAAARLAEWDWNEFWKFWRKQGGKTTGVVGIATIAVLIGALIIVSSKKV